MSLRISGCQIIVSFFFCQKLKTAPRDPNTLRWRGSALLTPRSVLQTPDPLGGRPPAHIRVQTRPILQLFPDLLNVVIFQHKNKTSHHENRTRLKENATNFIFHIFHPERSSRTEGTPSPSLWPQSWSSEGLFRDQELQLIFLELGLKLKKLRVTKHVEKRSKTADLKKYVRKNDKYLKSHPVQSEQ